MKNIKKLKVPNKGIYPWEDDMFADYIIENRKKINELVKVVNLLRGRKGIRN
jgi:hypothetical protein